MNKGGQLSLWDTDLFPSATYPEVAFLDHMGVLLFTFWRLSKLFSWVGTPIYIPSIRHWLFINSVWKSPVSLPWWLRQSSICLQCRSPGLRRSPGRRQWQPTPVFLPVKSHRWRSLVGYSPWARKELDTTERLHQLLLCHFCSDCLGLNPTRQHTGHIVSTVCQKASFRRKRRAGKAAERKRACAHMGFRGRRGQSFREKRTKAGGIPVLKAQRKPEPTPDVVVGPHSLSSSSPWKTSVLCPPPSLGFMIWFMCCTNQHQKPANPAKAIRIDKTFLQSETTMPHTCTLQKALNCTISVDFYYNICESDVTCRTSILICILTDQRRELKCREWKRPTQVTC